MKNRQQNLKDRFDVREGICRTCGVEAINGCCERHQMYCPLCNGAGAVTRDVWEAFYKKRFGHTTSCVSGKYDDLKKWLFDRIDEIAVYGCESCCSDSHNCTCQRDTDLMKTKMLDELTERLGRCNSKSRLT